MSSSRSRPRHIHKNLKIEISNDDSCQDIRESHADIVNSNQNRLFQPKDNIIKASKKFKSRSPKHTSNRSVKGENLQGCTFKRGKKNGDHVNPKPPKATRKVSGQYSKLSEYNMWSKFPHGDETMKEARTQCFATPTSLAQN